MKIMVAYDGSLQSKEALAYGMEKARETGGEVIALHVFNSGVFTDYDVIDAEATARREAAQHLNEAKYLISQKGNGVRASLFTAEGNPEEELIRFAKDRKADVLLCPSGFRRIINKYKEALDREFGGETSGLNLAVLSTKTL